mgnify:CR=1 FL=1
MISRQFRPAFADFVVRNCVRGALGALGVAIFFASFFPAHAIANEAALWKALRSPGHFALIRHALAPGTGDPEGFRIGDCGTQRNLSDAGRTQARNIGVRLRENGIRAATVFSSQWCRCLETARLLGLGHVEELAFLNSFFARAEDGDPQDRALRQWLANRNLGRPTILVTHQVNITALSGIYPASGEIVVVGKSNSGELLVLGSIKTD